MTSYQIRLKDGHTYDFCKFRKLLIEERNGVMIMELEIQTEPRHRYKRAAIYLESLKYFKTVEE